MQKLILDELNKNPLTIPELVVKLGLSRGQVTRNVKTMIDNKIIYRTLRAGPLYVGSSPLGKPVIDTDPDIYREKTPTGHIVRFLRHRSHGAQTHGKQIFGASSLNGIY